MESECYGFADQLSSHVSSERVLQTYNNTLIRPNVEQNYRLNYWAAFYGTGEKKADETADHTVFVGNSPSTNYTAFAGCHSEIGYGRFLHCMVGFWHPPIWFRCHICNSPISGHELISMYGGYPYHRSCFEEQYHPKCGVCKQFIFTPNAGLIIPFWDQKICVGHLHDGTPRCCSCARMEPQDTSYVALEVGRKLCLECLDSAIMDTNQCQPLYLDIQEFYENLNMKVEQQVPLLLVGKQVINEIMEGEEKEAMGLCLCKGQTISFVLEGLKMNMSTELHSLTHRGEVAAILVLYGLPRLLTGAILAHEMMHAWLRLKGFHKLNRQRLDRQIEEGICQVLSYMWLESQLTSSSDGSNSSMSTSNIAQISSRSSKISPVDMKLGKYFMYQIESHTSPVYRDGFRAAYDACRRYGLERTLNYIQRTGCLPF